MSIVFCGIMPHPPIALPEVGGAEAAMVSATREAMLELGSRIKNSGAEALVIISPHAPVFGDAIAINALPETKGNMGRFGAEQVSLTYKYAQVARESLASHLEGKWKDPDSYAVPSEFAGEAGVFVSLKKDARLRGCIGTTSPTRKNIIQRGSL